MQISRWYKILGITLLLTSIAFYSLEYIIFQDPYHLFNFMVAKLAFLPIEVLIVTMVIHQILYDMEKRQRLEKLNMVIGTFFSEVGTRLLTYFSDWDPNLDDIKSNLVITKEWTDSDFMKVKNQLKNYEYEVDINRVDLKHLRNMLIEHRDFLVRLLENPNLLEHETFTELLRAVFHMTEELISRTEDLDNLPESDLDHLRIDIERVYGKLVVEWLDYMEYMKDNYPYLFSLAMRKNPFDESASPVVK
ncbi:conserved hypothetical protein [Methanohalobium evestigatum Z-7303]|uniref:Uncharacterized protein n=1 Tax=Methanohalobium evestigatum (strain ATCC BAA-1072 / DSM 3721 / NBRC 107634 / OCM 161 / Z-7303) TaxID=644295 RepID=D7E9B1_METEZ|nr:hypothetical protein [Methanohalobium evestigatum]ADI74183.1 conserved hypothetical protein [Methanohalobium evestigatum Z-7303]